MATIAYIILILTFSSTIHARESQFFAKVSNNNNNNLKETQQPLNTNKDFNPQSQESGTYGHESGQLPPSATTNNQLPANLPENYNPVAYTTPIHSTTQDIPEEFNDPQQYNTQSGMYNSEKQGMSDTRFLENGRYYNNGYNNNGYNSQKQGFEDASFMETEDGGNTYKSEKQGENGRYNSQMQRYSTTNNANMYIPEKQGMSDTRFLENGKYYHDINMDNVNPNANMNSRGFNSRNDYNTQGYYRNNENSIERNGNSIERNGYNSYGNNGNSYDRYNSNGGYQNSYGNNGNSYDRYNSNGGYQNQEEFQDEQFNFNP